MSQTSLHACLQRVNTMQISPWHQTRNRLMHLTSSAVWQTMARFRNFYNVKKVKTWFKKAQCVSNRCRDLFKQKKYFGVIGTLRMNKNNCTANLSDNRCELLHIWVIIFIKMTSLFSWLFRSCHNIICRRNIQKFVKLSYTTLLPVDHVFRQRVHENHSVLQNFS